jgi:hypothetical protein
MTAKLSAEEKAIIDSIESGRCNSVADVDNEKTATPKSPLPK